MEAWSMIIKTMTKPRIQSMEATRCEIRFSGGESSFAQLGQESPAW
jgi:hypothetical protein